jgi:hypothetical protein
MMSDSVLIGINRKGNALLCYFWGETDCPVVVVAKTTGDVKRAIAENWTGDENSEETIKAMFEIASNDFSLDGKFKFDFEIGGADFTDVCVN